MAETIIDPVQAGKPQTGAGQTGAAQAGAGLARSPVESGPITADLGTIVTRAARRFGAKTALIAPGRTLTYSELDDLCDRVAGGLHDIGVRPGDRISLYSPNRWEWVIAYHAALRAGAVVNPVNVMLTAEEVAFVLNDCGAAAIFTSGDKAEVIAGLTRSVPTLRRVISFDGAGSGVTGFGELLGHPATAPEVPRPARPTCRRSAIPPAPPAIPRERCSRTGPSSSTARPCSRSRRGPTGTCCSAPCRCRTSTATW